jgi:hypothetical protein
MNLCFVFLGLALLWFLWEFILGYPPADTKYKNISAKQQLLLIKSAEAFFPEGGKLPSASEAKVVAYLDQMLVQLPRQQRILIRLLFILIEHGPLIFGPLQVRTTRQSVKARMKYFEGWESSRWYFRRLAFLSLRSLMTIAYFSCPRVEEVLTCEASS